MISTLNILSFYYGKCKKCWWYVDSGNIRLKTFSVFETFLHRNSFVASPEISQVYSSI